MKRFGGQLFSLRKDHVAAITFHGLIKTFVPRGPSSMSSSDSFVLKFSFLAANPSKASVDS